MDISPSSMPMSGGMADSIGFSGNSSFLADLAGDLPSTPPWAEQPTYGSCQRVLFNTAPPSAPAAASPQPPTVLPVTVESDYRLSLPSYRAALGPVTSKGHP